jgi:hypothetical protein
MCKNAANVEDQNNDAVVELIHQGNAVASNDAYTLPTPINRTVNAPSRFATQSLHRAVLQGSLVKPPNQRHKDVLSMDAFLEGHQGLGDLV